MKVLSMALLRVGAGVDKPVYLCHEVDVSDFGYFTRGGCVVCARRLRLLSHRTTHNVCCSLLTLAHPSSSPPPHPPTFAALSLSLSFSLLSLSLSLSLPIAQTHTRPHTHIYSAKEMLTFTTRMLMGRTEAGKRQAVKHNDYMCYCYTLAEGIGAVVICDEEYPARVAFGLMNKVIDEFMRLHSGLWQTQTVDSALPFPSLAATLLKAQDPMAVDKVMKIQAELDSTKEVLHSTIDGVLERGAKLDELVDRSDDLSRQSKMFYKGAKDTNSCCVVC